MQTFLFIAMRVVGGLCLLLVILVIAVAELNRQQQKTLQWRQQELVQGMLGPEAQRISAEVIQDIGNAARYNATIRELLSRYGYQLPSVMDSRASSPPEVRRVVESSPVKESP